MSWEDDRCCPEDFGGSHYHCARCGKVSGMMGHYQGNEKWSCDPDDLLKVNEAQAHESDCPDPKCQLGQHVTCPCYWCLDTGFLEADPDEIECDCGAFVLKSLAERQALIAEYRKNPDLGAVLWQRWARKKK